MIFTEYTDLNDFIRDIEIDGQYTVCSINRSNNLTVSTKNGYKIFKVLIEKDDPFFEPEDYHGDRIYTFVSNKFKDCKAVAIPYISFARLTNEEAISKGYRNGKDEVLEWYTEYESNPEFIVYIGNGYLNIMTNRQYISLFFSEDDSLEGSEIGVILILDCMYKNRNNALNKLLSIANTDD